MYKETFTQIQPKNAKMPTLGPASRWSPLGSTHSVTGWDEGINTYAKLSSLEK